MEYLDAKLTQIITSTSGIRGPQGYQGPKGDTGATGAQGTTGTQGTQGITGPVGGANTQVIFNDAGVANGDPDFVFYKANNTMSVANLTVPGTTTITSDTLIVGNATANMTVTNTNVTKNTISIIPFGQQTIWVPAVAMTARTSNGAAAGTVETTTNDVMIKTYDFDATTAEYVQFAIQMPKSWNEGTLVAQFLWSHAATTTNFGVAWGLQAVGFADSNALDTAFGTAQVVTDTGGTTNALYITTETAAITVAGTPTAEEYVVYQAYRDPANAGDTMAIDARLHGIKIHYTTDAATDD